jgi:hypothetical protein
VPQALEIAAGKGLGEDVHGVVCRTHLSEGNRALLNHLADIVEFYMDVFDIGMASVVLGQAPGSIIVAQERHGSEWGETETTEESLKECQFMRGIMKGNVFGIAGGICNNLLFLEHP